MTVNTLREKTKYCFEQWKIRLERCRDGEGKYIEGDEINRYIILLEGKTYIRLNISIHSLRFYKRAYSRS